MGVDDVNDDGLALRFAGLAADIAGHADRRPPLVFLHGLTFDRTMWRPALIELQLSVGFYVMTSKFLETFGVDMQTDAV